MLTFEGFREVVTGSSMIRVEQRLAPMGAGGLVYPPTYAVKSGSKHLFRQAWIDGEQHKVVVLDSPQSQSNRVEDAVMEAMEAGQLTYPDIRVDVPRRDGVTEHYSVLQLSHRIYDAVLFAATLDGVPYRKSEVGRALLAARPKNATAVFHHAPLALVLGAWNSHTGGGPLSAKFQRLLTSEIIGVDAEEATRGAVKFDPMDIREAAGPLVESLDPARMFELAGPSKGKSKQKGTKKPSELGFGNVPALEERGASVAWAVQNAYISMPAVRRLAFPDEHGKRSPARDVAGRVAVTALALYGIAQQAAQGYSLRSGCDLVAERAPVVQALGRTLEDVQPLSVDVPDTKKLLDTCLEKAAEHGLRWRERALELQADERLVTMVERSRAVSGPQEN